MSYGKYLGMSFENLTAIEQALREHIMAGDNNTASHIIWHPLIPEWGEIRGALAILKRARAIVSEGTDEATK